MNDEAATTPPPPDGQGPASGPLPDERLPCGAVVDELLEQVAEGKAGQRDPHQQQCPHCQASLRELDRLWTPVRGHANAEIPIPAGLVASVMGSIRTLVRDVWYTLDLTEGGQIRVAARVIAVLARNAARRVPGVRVALGRSTATRTSQLVEKATFGHRHPHAAVGVLGRTAVVDLALAVAYGPPARAVAEQVQHEVTEELRRTIGLTNIITNVTIDDVYE